MSGGFILPPHSSLAQTSTGEEDEKPKIVLALEPLLSLTPRQEGRLRTHLDRRLVELERDSKTHGFGTLIDLVIRLRPILRLILQIPPVEPWSSMRTSYLLSYTGSITSYIASLPLLPAQPEGYDAGSAEEVMRQVIGFMNEVNDAWSVVLRGRGWVMDPSTSLGRSVRVPYTGTVGQTERTRLRSIVMTGRARLLAWARTYGSFPGSSFGHGSNGNGNGHGSAETATEDWEVEIMGMWNGILERLSGDEADEPSDDEEAGNDEYA